MAGYQTLIFTERLALPDSEIPRIPRTLVFWGVWSATTLSLAVVLYVPFMATLFRVSPLDVAQLSTAVVLGVAVVAWRLVPLRSDRWRV
jgi:hypothetical protein